MLLAHSVPNNVVVGQAPPAPADLSSLTQRGCVEETENPEAKLWWQSREEVDLDQVANGSGDVRQLREAALGEDALEHKIAVFGRSGGEERPDVGYGLLVGLGESTEFLFMGQHTVSHCSSEDRIVHSGVVP